MSRRLGALQKVDQHHDVVHADTDDDEYEHQRQIGQRDSKQRRQTETDDLGEHDHYHGAEAQRESGATERCSAQQ